MVMLQLPCFDTGCGYGLNEGLGLHLSAEFPFLTTPIKFICHVFVPCKVYQVREELIDLLREHNVLPACNMSCGPDECLKTISCKVVGQRDRPDMTRLFHRCNDSA